jgi:hypothetical protein
MRRTKPEKEDRVSSVRTNSYRRMALDHFEPEDSDPAEQRKLRGHLEQIDYTAFAANREVIGQVLGHADPGAFQRLGAAAAVARARWIAEAVSLSEASPSVNADGAARLAQLRSAYEELSEAYEGMRRMVERGYLSYQPAAKPS